MQWNGRSNKRYSKAIRMFLLLCQWSGYARGRAMEEEAMYERVVLLREDNGLHLTAEPISILGITSWRLMSARQHSAAFPATGRSVFSGVPSSRTDARLRQCSQQPSSLMCSVCRHNTASNPASSSPIERDCKEVASPHMKTQSIFLLCLTPSRSTVLQKSSPQEKQSQGCPHTNLRPESNKARAMRSWAFK